MDLPKFLIWAAAAGLAGWVGLALTHGPKLWTWLWNRGRDARLRELSDLEKAKKHASDSLAATEEARRYQKERDASDAAAKAELAKIDAERVAHAKELDHLKSAIKQSTATTEEAIAFCKKLLGDLEKQDAEKAGREAEFRLLKIEIDLARAMIARLALTDASPRQWLAIARFPSWPLVATAHSRRERLENLIAKYDLPFSALEIYKDFAHLALDPKDVDAIDIVPAEEPWYSSLGEGFLEQIRRDLSLMQ